MAYNDDTQYLRAWLTIRGVRYYPYYITPDCPLESSLLSLKQPSLTFQNQLKHHPP